MTLDTIACSACGTSNPAGSRFCNSCGAPLEAPAAAAAETRKTVTVLFIDATSSTALGERLDPESLRAVMTPYFDVMREVIEFHGGSVEKFIGDAVMAVFGVPTVHEDDALRACRAALEIHERLGTLDAEIRAERGASVEWRMGINTGEVVAGDTGSGQRLVTGDAVNVAARLEAAAEPGQILLGADTHAVLREDVTAEPVEPLALKGKAEPVAAWRLLAARQASGRRSRPLEAPLVGRRRPLRLLDEAFREAVEERICHLFTVLGTAGVGKSRLIEEFIGSVGDGAQVAIGRCLPYGHGITYWPAMEAIRHGLRLAEDADADETLGRLRELLQGDPDADRIAAVIGHLMGFTAEVPPPSDIFWGIRRVLERFARQRPLVLVFDDIHWGEATFLDLIDHVADWTQDAPIVLIAMARPELLEKRLMWGGGKRWSTTVQLEPLSDAESDELVGSLLGRAELPEEARGQITRAAEGNPLFVEELLGKLIDDGFLVPADDGWAALGDLRELVVPPTIQALMAARLDSLGRDERTVIERASVEGKVFHRGAVTALAPEPIRDDVPERLATLTRMELLRPDQASFAGEEAYRFRHLLIRDAAYQALAKQTRSELHERFAEWLERTAAERLGEYEEILGYHYEQAYRYRLELGPADDHTRSLAERAGHLLAAAARRADGRLDVGATADLLERAIELLAHDDPERRLLIGQLGLQLLAAGRGSRAQALLEEVLATAQVAGDERAAAWAELTLVAVRSSTESLSAAEQIQIAERTRDRLAALGDAQGAQTAELIRAFGLFSSGRAAKAMAAAQAVLDSQPADRRVLLQATSTSGASAVWGPVPTDEVIDRIRTNMRNTPELRGGSHGLARMLLLQGRFEEARREADFAQRAYRDVGDRHMMAELEAVRGDIARFEERIDDAVAMHRAGYEGKLALGDQAFASTSAVEYSRALATSGQLDEALRMADIALATSAHDDIASQGGGRSAKANALSLMGRHDEAVAVGREGVAIMGGTDYLYFWGECEVDLAWVLWRAGQRAEALDHAETALDLYQQKGATLLAERTRTQIAAWEAAGQ